MSMKSTRSEMSMSSSVRDEALTDLMRKKQMYHRFISDCFFSCRWRLRWRLQETQMQLEKAMLDKKKLIEEELKETEVFKLIDLNRTCWVCCCFIFVENARRGEVIKGAIFSPGSLYCSLLCVALDLFFSIILYSTRNVTVVICTQYNAVVALRLPCSCGLCNS